LGHTLRIANVEGRLTVVTKAGAVDVERRSQGAFDARPEHIYDRWDEFLQWARDLDPSLGEPLDESRLGPPSPRPRQVFAVGLNYAPHAAEAGLAKPSAPLVFTKFQSCIAGPNVDVGLPSDTVDWEIELVAVIGRAADHVPASQAWSYVAGLTVGQDYSDRVVQQEGPAPQFSLGKSFAGFGPTGPWLVTTDEFTDPDDVGLECEIDGATVQRGRTRDLLFPVPELVARISAICCLYPGDLLFTGTPEGTGAGRTPPRYLRAGEVVVSRIEGIGTMRNRCVSARSRFG
jgi:2,4-diketo-3-deoxy-L-fuconate hydrolase